MHATSGSARTSPQRLGCRGCSLHGSPRRIRHALHRECDRPLSLDRPNQKTDRALSRTPAAPLTGPPRSTTQSRHGAPPTTGNARSFRRLPNPPFARSRGPTTATRFLRRAATPFHGRQNRPRDRPARPGLFLQSAFPASTPMRQFAHPASAGRPDLTPLNRSTSCTTGPARAFAVPPRGPRGPGPRGHPPTRRGLFA